MDPAFYFSLVLNLHGHLTSGNCGVELHKSQDASCLLWQMAKQDIQQMATHQRDARASQGQPRGHAPVFINYILVS